MHQQNTQTNLFKNNLQGFPRGSGAEEGVSILRYKLGKSPAALNSPPNRNLPIIPVTPSCPPLQFRHRLSELQISSRPASKSELLMN